MGKRENLGHYPQQSFSVANPVQKNFLDELNGSKNLGKIVRTAWSNILSLFVTKMVKKEKVCKKGMIAIANSRK